MKHFYYATADNRGIIRVRAVHKPCAGTVPRSGTWVVNELNSGQWLVPCAPEISLAKLGTLKYLGSNPIEEPIKRRKHGTK